MMSNIIVEFVIMIVGTIIMSILLKYYNKKQEERNE